MFELGRESATRERVVGHVRVTHRLLPASFPEVVEP